MCGPPASGAGWSHPGAMHVAVMTGLVPGKRYYYRFGDEVRTSHLPRGPCYAACYEPCSVPSCAQARGPLFCSFFTHAASQLPGGEPRVDTLNFTPTGRQVLARVLVPRGAAAGAGRDREIPSGCGHGPGGAGRQPRGVVLRRQPQHDQVSALVTGGWSRHRVQQGGGWR